MKRIYAMKAWIFGGLFLLLLLGSCSGSQNLQEYYVDNSENPNFISLDVPASILKLEEANLDASQQEALQSLHKLNILAFKKTEANAQLYQEETAKVKAILKAPQFKELIQLNTKYGKGVVKYLGSEDAIDEVVIYGHNKDNGFAVIRVLGKNMNPAHFVQLLQAIDQADFKGSGLGELSGMLKG